MTVDIPVTILHLLMHINYLANVNMALAEWLVCMTCNMGFWRPSTPCLIMIGQVLAILSGTSHIVSL